VTCELLEGDGEVVFVQLPDDPNPVASEGVLCQGLVSQPHFSSPEIKKSLLDPVPVYRVGVGWSSCGFGDELLHNGSRVNRQFGHPSLTLLYQAQVFNQDEVNCLNREA